MCKIIDLNSQEVKDKLKEKCFTEINKTLFNDNLTQYVPVIETIQKICKKYKITKDEFISYCKEIKQWDFFDKLPWQQHNF